MPDTGVWVDGVYIPRQVTDVYSRPPKGDRGIFLAIYSRMVGRRVAQAAIETAVSQPSVGVVIGDYDPVISALLAGELG